MKITAEEIRNSKSVVLRSREINDSIVSYLLSTIDEQQSIEFFFESKFETEVVESMLDRQLPRHVSGEGRVLLISDMVELGAAFFMSTKSKHIRFQLEIVETDMCRLFHEDRMRQRLLCTYLGPGTEWLDHSNVKREGLRKGNNDNIVKDNSKVNNSKPFELLLLKGSLYDEGEEGVVHRSPPIEKDELVRVLFKIDECLPS